MVCTCLFEDDTSVQGKLSIVGEEITVITNQGEQQYRRSDLRAVIVGELSEKNYWSLKLSWGNNVDGCHLKVKEQVLVFEDFLN